MDKILPNTFPPSADPTVFAVIYSVRTIAVPKLTYIAVVPSRKLVAILAILARRLRGIADHAEHVLRLLAVQRVVFHIVVAVSACIPLPTVEALDLDVALVVLAAEAGRFVAVFYIPWRLLTLYSF